MDSDISINDPKLVCDHSVSLKIDFFPSFFLAKFHSVSTEASSGSLIRKLAFQNFRIICFAQMKPLISGQLLRKQF